MIRIILSLTLGLVITLLASGCTHGGEGRTVIRFWAMGNEAERVQQLIADFERSNPDVHVELQQVPWTAAHEKLLTAVAGDAMPDVCQLGNTWIPEFAVMNVLTPLAPFIVSTPSVHIEDFFPGVLQTNAVDSILYGIPWYVDTRVLFYRRDLLAAAGFPHPPRTWDEVRLVCDALKSQAAREGRTCYPFFLPTNEWVPAIILGMQSGGHFLADRNTRGNFRGPEFRRAFTLLTDLYRRGYSPSGMQYIMNMYQSFGEGMITMYITGPWNIGEFRLRIPAAQQDAWMTAPLPSMDTTWPGTSLPLGTSLILFRACRHPREAWRFIEYVTGAERQVTFYSLTGNLPSRRSAWNDTALTNNVYARSFYEQLRRVEPLPAVPEWEQIVIKLQDYVEAAATGSMSVDEALRRMDEETDQMLVKRRWLLAHGKEER